MVPHLHEGEYVFCTVKEWAAINPQEVVGTFREEEGWTLVMPRIVADRLQLPYAFIASWITLTIHSSLEAVGLTAAFSKALRDRQISCNVMAGYFHDHIFVPVQDAAVAIEVLQGLTLLRT